MISILITGFGPFPGVPRNPSAWLTKSVSQAAALRWSGIRASVFVLQTSYAALEMQLVPLLKQPEPDCVLMLGVAARRKRICVESRATNRATANTPDAEGQRSHLPILAVGATHALQPRISLQPILRALTGPGIRPLLSRNAGRYLCNAAYFRALGLMQDRPVIFIHVPMPRVRGRRRGRGDQRPDMKQMQAALVRAARMLVILSRRNQRTGGS